MTTAKSPEHPPLPRYVDIHAVANMLSVNRATIDRWIADEGFPCVRISERIRRFDVAAVQAWIDSRWSARDAGEAA